MTGCEEPVRNATDSKQLRFHVQRGTYLHSRSMQRMRVVGESFVLLAWIKDKYQVKQMKPSVFCL